MYETDATAQDLVENPKYGVLLNGRKFHIETPIDTEKGRITLVLASGEKQRDNETDSTLTLSFEELTERLQSPDEPVELYR